MFYCYVTVGPIVLQEPPVTSHSTTSDASTRAARLSRIVNDGEEITMYDSIHKAVSVWDGVKWKGKMDSSQPLSEMVRQMEETK